VSRLAVQHGLGRGGLREVWRRLVLIRTQQERSYLCEVLELLGGEASLAKDGAHRPASNLPMAGNDNGPAFSRAQLHVTATLADLFEAGLRERAMTSRPE